MKTTSINNAAVGAGKQNNLATFAAPLIAEPHSPAGVEPEFIAIPGPSQICPYSGLRRGMLYALSREGLIKTVSLRRPGRTRGRRLVVLSTLRDYLRGLNAEQNAHASANESAK